LKIYSNLNKNGESWNIAGKTIPATGFYAKMDDGSVEAFLLEHDYVSSPEYIYLGTTDKPVQENGITLKSGRVAIAYENATSFRVYPTVNLKDLTFNPKTLKLPVAPEYRVEISDLDGKLLDKKTFKMEDGKITLDHTVNKATCYIFFTEKVK
jgi:hypothetical protein